MNRLRFAALASTLCLAACSGAGDLPANIVAAAPSPATSSAKPQATAFTPPPESAIPNDEFGKQIELGRKIFTETAKYAPGYVGNQLNCENCHLDAGRLAGSGPLWGAYSMYPAYRAKNHHVNTFTERLQGCFMYSMNGKAPPADSAEMVALETYAYWMSQGEPVGKELAGRGYPKLAKPVQAPDFARGEQVFKRDCALCHGPDGQGQMAAGKMVFPPLWGPQSFNWGAGMHEVDKAASFIKANMPLGRGNTLTEQDAWDAAYFMNAHERPQDPRYAGNVAQTRAKFHDTPQSLYGVEVNGQVLGQGSAAH
ncbi:c-type cytochrome [Dyella subtropica]|uniref:c-type cytochrome n=1 Tax=Dyella subtropica TaxID=2992127 RepID=UPI0022553711|nr:c-type cytochrome [Dyella subtropica]